MIRKILTVLVPVGVVVVAGLGVMTLLQIAKPRPEKADEVVFTTSVFVEDVRTETVQLSVTTQGEARPRAEIELVPQVAGRVAYVAPGFLEGGIFEKGETLVKVEDDDYRFAVVRAEATVAQARQALALEEAEAELARADWEALGGEKEASALTLRQPQLAQARAQYNAARADLNRARLDLGRTTITAPFNGRVRTKNADIGQYVAPGSSIGRIFSTDVVEVRLPLTDTQLALLDLPIAFEAASRETAPKAVISTVVAGDLRTWDARIMRTDAAVDPRTRLVFAIAEVEAPYDAPVPLAVGLFVNAEIEGRTLENVLTAPMAALRNSDLIYIAGPEDRMEIRKVDVVTFVDDKVVLRDGVRAGERAVVSPIRNPARGMVLSPLYKEESAEGTARANGRSAAPSSAEDQRG